MGSDSFIQDHSPGEMSVLGSLLYLKDGGAGQQSYWYNYEPSQEQLARDGNRGRERVDNRMQKVTIYDARQQQPQFTLDVNSFQLFNCESTMPKEDFYGGDEHIKKNYYSKMEDLIKEATGAEHVYIFNHMVRNASKGLPYSVRVHSDTCALHARDLFLDFAKDLEPRFSRGRFLYISTWQNISKEPIENDHLAMCDSLSVCSPDDYVTCDYYNKDRPPIQHYRLEVTNWRRHKWYFYPRMTNSEVLLFKQYDSDPSLSGRICFHSSFLDEAGPQGYTRESIECRAYAFFPNHTPNTCPEPQETRAAA